MGVQRAVRGWSSGQRRRVASSSSSSSWFSLFSSLSSVLQGSRKIIRSGHQHHVSRSTWSHRYSFDRINGPEREFRRGLLYVGHSYQTEGGGGFIQERIESMVTQDRIFPFFTRRKNILLAIFQVLFFMSCSTSFEMNFQFVQSWASSRINSSPQVC